VQKYTVVLTPEQWHFLKVYAAQITARDGIEMDRSAVLRALVDKLQAGRGGVP